MPRSIVELSLKMMKEAPSLTCITIWDGFSRKQEEEDDGRDGSESNGDLSCKLGIHCWIKIKTDKDTRKLSLYVLMKCLLFIISKYTEDAELLLFEPTFTLITMSDDLPNKDKARLKEQALLEKLYSSLDNHISAPDQEHLCGSIRIKTPARPVIITTTTDSKNLIKSVLAVKMLAKSIAKACLAEMPDCDAEDNLVKSVVDRFKAHYPTLKPAMVYDAIHKQMASEYESGNSQSEEGGGESKQGEPTDGAAITERSLQQKVTRCTTKVTGDMEAYYAKIIALKRARRESAENEAAAAEDITAPKPTKRSRAATPKRMNKNREDSRAGRPTKEMKEFFDVCEMKYEKERETYGGDLPIGQWEIIVNTTKQELGLHDLEMTAEKLSERCMRRYRKKIRQIAKANAPPGATINPKNPHDRRPMEMRVHDRLVNECYDRWVEFKKSNGKKTKLKMQDEIINEVRMEMSQEYADITNETIKNRIRVRYRKEHGTTNKVMVHILTGEDKERYLNLLDTIVERFAELKEASQEGQLPDGTLAQLIESTKRELGCTDLEVRKDNVRIKYHKQKKKTPLHTDLDESLVIAINNAFSMGRPVTREHGLSLANSMLQVQKGGEDDGEVLDSKWWRSFLVRNKNKLSDKIDRKVPKGVVSASLMAL